MGHAAAMGRGMLIAHLVAACGAVLLVHSERALWRLVTRLLPRLRPLRLPNLPLRPRLRATHAGAPLRLRAAALGGVGRRGPPSGLCAAA